MPRFLFVVLFGLSVDYHVFVLSLVRELVDRGRSAEQAVAEGIKSTAGVIISAAAVMVVAFAAFATGSVGAGDLRPRSTSRSPGAWRPAYSRPASYRSEKKYGRASNGSPRPSIERTAAGPCSSALAQCSTSEHVELEGYEGYEGYEGHIEQLEGGYTVAFERYTADADLGPFFAGLPDDRCQAAHWGYVIAGKVSFKFADREETYEAGDAYYAPPGHTPVLFAGTEIVEFSPTEQLDRTFEVVARNMEAAAQTA